MNRILFVAIILLFFASGAKAAMTCEYLFQRFGSLNESDANELAYHLNNYFDIRSPKHLEWIENELDEVTERLKVKSEREYTVYGANSRSRRSDFSYQELVEAKKMIKDSQILYAGTYAIRKWLLHRLLKLPEKSLEGLSNARGENDVERFFIELGWSPKLSSDAAVVQFSNNGYTPAITLAKNESLTPHQVKDLVESLRIGRPYTSERAQILSVKYCENSNDLYKMTDAGFKFSIDPRLGIVTYTHKISKGKILLPTVALFGTPIQFTAGDQAGFLSAALSGVEYIYPGIVERLNFRGKPLPSEWSQLQDVVTQGSIKRILIAMNWRAVATKTQDSITFLKAGF